MSDKGTFRIQLEYKLADFWIGVYWRREAQALHIWICVLPCLPIHLTYQITEIKETH